MAYNAIAQTDHEVASNATSSDAGSPPPTATNNAFQPISRDMDRFSGGSFVDQAHTAESSGGRLGSMMRSITSTSYDMLEDDDYEAADPPDHRSNTRQSGPVPHHDTTTNSLPHSPSPEPLIRSPTGHSIPLRHPTPDLQSLQGAYVGNVERLEKSAERLSVTSDIGEELRKMDLELKRRSSASSAPPQGTDSPVRQFSTASLSNSIIGVNNAARNGGYSPGGFISSPRGSIMSGSFSQGGTRLRSTSIGSQLAQVPEPEQEEENTLADQAAPVVPTLLPPLPPSYVRHDNSQPQQSSAETEYTAHDGELPDRPSTAASNDTYRQATTLFTDFDGVHFVPHPRDSDSARRVSLNRPPLASGSEHYEQPPNGQDMVYYPAPVPMMLNLPPRLSKRPPVSEIEKRRTQLLGVVAADNRKSALSLPGLDKEAADNKASKRLSKLPPQLRASVFFDQPPTHLDIQVKHESAVATLDSILEASAHAPVTAFTDHPFAGHVGAEVYGSAKHRASSKNLADKKKKRGSKSTLGFRQSTMTAGPRQSRVPSGEMAETEMDAAEATPEATPLRLSTYDAQNGDENHQNTAHDDNEGSDRSEDEGQEADETSDDDENEEEPTYFGPPTTLLAELQMRKQEQKQRTRTAATAFPNGMHSTLLELDAVAQVQSKARRQKHVTLAWEHPDVHKQDAEDDEDVPLGVLFPDKTSTVNENGHLGLMEKRELEENEPLSRRRARLRGEPPVPRGSSPMKRASTMYTVDIPRGEDDSGDENETLAQRLKRLKEKNRTSTAVSNDFASEVWAQFESKSADAAEEKKDEPDEETLGQRRRRLQEEAKARQSISGPTAPKFRRSMANILQAHPAHTARKPSQDNSQFNRGPADHANRMAMYTLPPNLAHAAAGFTPQYPGQPMATPYTGMTPYNHPFMYNNAGVMGMNNLGYGMPYGRQSMMMQPTIADESIDPRHADMIDRWRQSVR